jgi:cytoskeleton-associated protein 5
VRELYELQKKYPQTEARINNWLAGTGTYFQSYIRRAMENHRNEDYELEGNTSKDASPTPTTRESDYA